MLKEAQVKNQWDKLLQYPRPEPMFNPTPTFTLDEIRVMIDWGWVTEFERGLNLEDLALVRRLEQILEADK